MCTSNGQEEVLEIEIESTKNAAGLRKRISDLYGFPVKSQRLQLTPDLGGAPLLLTTPVVQLVTKAVYLLPADIDLEEPEQSGRRASSLSHQEAAADEREAVLRSVAESLKGVKYTIHFNLPEVDSKQPEGKTLSVDALAPVGDVMVMLELEMTGFAGQLPLMLVHHGQVLPAPVPLHFAGVSDGDRLDVVIGGQEGLLQSASGMEDYSDDDEDDDPVARWAAH